MKRRHCSIAYVILLILSFQPSFSLANDDCLECHDRKEPVVSASGATRSIYVDEKVFNNSVHGEKECLDCHEDAEFEEVGKDTSKPPHPAKLEKVQCGTCHLNSKFEFESSIHGKALQSENHNAPTCQECHGGHDVLSPKNPLSPVHRTKSPLQCGKCHRDDAPVKRGYEVTKENAAENFTKNDHGETFFQKGLLVSATCIDCHRGHRVLPSTDPESSVSHKNIMKTCGTCHALIEAVHRKVIRLDLWSTKPWAIPSCENCHPPHKKPKLEVEVSVLDQACLECHEREETHKTVGGKAHSLKVEREELSASVHRDIPCAKCHSDVDPGRERPCETAVRVECSDCHAKFGEEYFAGGHGKAFQEKKGDAPYCTTCHGTHNVKLHLDESAPTFRSAIPALCGGCHREDGRAEKSGNHLSQKKVLADYSTSVHGKGLMDKGLMASAVCTDCHNSHRILNHSQEGSAVHHKNIPSTCGECHKAIYKKYVQSVHYSPDPEKMKKLPTCADCHSAHKISEIDKDKFKKEVTEQCGSCHKELAESYFDTMHGKGLRLGHMAAAKCSDCHSAHEVQKESHPDSTVGSARIVQTCRKCHEGANLHFAGFLTHVTHHYSEKYPVLYYTYIFMTALLVSVFAFFGIHTLLWLPRSLKFMRERRARRGKEEARHFIRRFTLSQRITHIFVMTSFLSLALTGMMVRYSSQPWAGVLADLLGGVVAAGKIHRVAAVVTFGYFFYHLLSLVILKRRKRVGWLSFIFGKESLMFNGDDLREFWGTMKWFVGLGERPRYGRWTYWEKFDYFAVFWGVVVIGSSGLVLWFPEAFTRFFPGWAINVATIIHSDEALLAVGFIFTVHFFNTHLRPESFPLDPVIFSGVVSVEEYKETRPRDYEAIKESGELGKWATTERLSRAWEILFYLVGAVFLTLGIIMIGLIIYSGIFS